MTINFKSHRRSGAKRIRLSSLEHHQALSYSDGYSEKQSTSYSDLLFQRRGQENQQKTKKASFSREVFLRNTRSFSNSTRFDALPENWIKSHGCEGHHFLPSCFCHTASSVNDLTRPGPDARARHGAGHELLIQGLRGQQTGQSHVVRLTGMRPAFQAVQQT